MSINLKIRFAGTQDVTIIENLAQIIWPVTYGEIVSASQLHYMLDMIYRPDALIDQMTNQHQTFLVAELDNEPVAFAAYSFITPTICKLHKIYVHQRTQGKGIGKSLIDFIVAHVQPQGIQAIRLNVNRHNKARSFYEKLGFKVIAEEDIDIGNNFFMNDYIMEKPIADIQ